MGILATRSFLIILIWLLFLIYFVFLCLISLKVLISSFYSIILWYFYGFLSSHEALFIGGRAICDNLQILAWEGNSLVPHDLLKRSWLSGNRCATTQLTSLGFISQTWVLRSCSLFFRKDPEVTTRG